MGKNGIKYNFFKFKLYKIYEMIMNNISTWFDLIYAAKYEILHFFFKYKSILSSFSAFFYYHIRIEFHIYLHYA